MPIASLSRLLMTGAFSLVLGIFPYYRATPENSTQTPVTSASPECLSILGIQQGLKLVSENQMETPIVNQNPVPKLLFLFLPT